jgi:hypothetical protein
MHMLAGGEAVYTGSMRSASCSCARGAARPWLRLGALLAAGAVVYLLSQPAHAQWKWRDPRGQVTISDTPPPRDIPDKDILQRPSSRPAAAPAEAAPAQAAAPGATPAASAPAGKTALESEVEKRRKAVEAEAQAKAKADEARLAAQRKEACASARNHLQLLESGMRIVRYNAKGEQEVLDDKQRAEELRRTREVIAADCR